jgi:apoptosis-inducing factor 1
VTKVAELASGKKIQFKKCLIATGSSPVWPTDLDTPEDEPRVRTFRTADDFQALYRAAKDPATQHITVIGGGFLGTELAGALSLRSASGLKVAQIVSESGVISQVFPDYLSNYVTGKLKNKDGIDVRTQTRAKSVTKATDGSNRLVVELEDGSQITTDFVVVAAGVKPNVGIAEDANFEIDRNNGGVVVNHEFQIRSDIYAAGDVASYWDYQLGVRRRETHNDHALRSGALAGLNMTGRRKAYTYEPAYTGFFSDDAYLAVGILDSKLETVGVWQKGTPSLENPDTTSDDNFQASNTFDKGAVYYLNDKRKVVGVLLWNMLDRAEEARHALFVLREFNDDVDKIKRQIYIGDVPPQAAAEEAAAHAGNSQK